LKCSYSVVFYYIHFIDITWSCNLLWITCISYLSEKICNSNINNLNIILQCAFTTQRFVQFQVHFSYFEFSQFQQITRSRYINKMNIIIIPNEYIIAFLIITLFARLFMTIVILVTLAWLHHFNKRGGRSPSN
jgi:hypothetical protein